MANEYYAILVLMELEAWERFCKLHPHEAFDMDKDGFCEFVRKDCPRLTYAEIESLIEQTRGKC